jgi:hypothetical protein
MTDEELNAIEERAKAAIPGPWRWNLSLKSKRIVLEAMTRGLEVVMDFARWGMSGAKPRFQTAGLMKDAELFAQVIPGREHHADWCQTISHADADFIAHARTDIPKLIEEIRRLRAQKENA